MMQTNMLQVTFMVQLWVVINASIGDKTLYFQNCKENCVTKNCTTEDKLKQFYIKQPLSLKLTLWSCSDECKYNCMWKTTEEFIKHGLDVPQFHGKWPFIRFLGMEEPASVFFSLLNLATYTYGTIAFFKRVPKDVPMYSVSLTMGILGITAWICAAIFHTRDIAITEKLDYFSAIILVTFGVYTCICRLSYGIKNPSRTNGNNIRVISFIILFILVTLHISYLSFIHFNYGYNMFANVTTGLANVVMWVLYHWISREKYTHQWEGSLSMFATALSIVLELFDFLPIYWILDAHALWHLSTFPIPIYWMNFLTNDALALEGAFISKIV